MVVQYIQQDKESTKVQIEMEKDFRRKEMGVLSKEAYERKREYAAKRMAENREIETLTEEQHDALESLCTLRHNMHTCDKGMFLTESADYKMWNSLDTVRAILTEAGLEELTFSINLDFVPSDYDEGNYDELLQDYYSSMETINNEIERYLRKVDKEHGTHYCPTGATRIY